MKIAFFIYFVCSYVFGYTSVLALHNDYRIDAFESKQQSTHQMSSYFSKMLIKSKTKKAMNKRLRSIPKSKLCYCLGIIEGYNFDDYSYISDDEDDGKDYFSIQLPNIDTIPRAQTPQLVLDIENAIVDHDNCDVSFNILDFIPNSGN